VDVVVVATSEDKTDHAIEAFCKEQGVPCYRGPLRNVALRFSEVLDHYALDGFVRVNGDSPLLDQALVERALKVFAQDCFDLVTNVLVRTYPKGQSVEVLQGDIFRKTVDFMKEEDLEHVTKFFYKHKDQFKIHNFEASEDYSGIQLSVDTVQDMQIFSRMVAAMTRPPWDYHLGELLHLYQRVQESGRQPSGGFQGGS
jgi:spore coat polysaccharide biosynthesis protein SpsF (cytidylyltransferase family)